MDTDSNQSMDNLKSKDFTFSTQVAVPNGQKAIQHVAIGDTVLAYTAKLESGTIKLISTEAEVTFSNGAPGDVGRMTYISSEPHDIVCSGNQPFLLIDGTYIKAEKLEPGQKLVNRDGNPVEIRAVKVGKSRNGIYHISTNAGGHGPDGHLLLINGVIAGDFTFEMFFDRL